MHRGLWLTPVLLLMLRRVELLASVELLLLLRWLVGALGVVELLVCVGMLLLCKRLALFGP